MFFKKNKKIKKVHGEELLTCPRCNIKMEKLKKQEVIIDVCRKCKGMWLDAGELQKLANISERLKKGAEKPKVKKKR